MKTECPFHLMRPIVIAIMLALACFSPAALADSLLNVNLSFSMSFGNDHELLATNYGSGNTGPIAQDNSVGWILDCLCEGGISTAHASADFGLLGVFATSTDYATPLANTSTQATAAASWADNLSFTNLHQSAMLEAVISLAGSSTTNGCTGQVDAEACRHASADYYAQFNDGSKISKCNLISAGSCSFFIPINSQSLVAFYGDVQVEADGSLDNAAGKATATADYRDTAKVDSLLIVDSNGNPI